jgi:hypothetical protein
VKDRCNDIEGQNVLAKLSQKAQHYIGESTSLGVKDQVKNGVKGKKEKE